MAGKDAASLQQFLNPPWMDDAACKGTDLAPFFSTDSVNKTYATRICGGCPVRGECLDYALVFDLDGIWGGLTDLQRKRMYPDVERVWLREEYFDQSA